MARNFGLSTVSGVDLLAQLGQRPLDGPVLIVDSRLEGTEFRFGLAELPEAAAKVQAAVQGRARR
ncbi:hypothetical protein UVI_02005220 [Ustilaginoidea virens]|uniref:Uncharacterized protein n=1 Tax=Ustilaginoidea virens TaxID=1159556 RepID=A0A1B5KXQ2_USTVR|nr:hypothetical protein UVI_02005220 [Ustilaginoidea virens]